ncbi:hypothetical protein Arnit_2410 [Arcobacter nitrofigilis DSM 7299]|uniref:Uncharacterized protein n=1 Tax=Arcobacter nitrofigilis (strain ATCC 33309 / DSM 7299 / CCUG 15893 / LMG 7604 / NCTC 12251 / CI) TaxID=572480 RepID=D5V199_ARCNC|nr:hypothetical protein [Arcobacter nitrofigilis]ADG94061.1 hypothetical protein Arnit_2410 [Arcobacter nitrofigilis DSM 7299]
MLNLEQIKKIKFSYFDSNGYVYPFEMIEDSIEFKNNELKCYMYCKVTNLSANGEVYLYLKIQENELFFRTNYFANSTEYTKLIKNGNNLSYKVDFAKDYLELNLEQN